MRSLTVALFPAINHYLGALIGTLRNAFVAMQPVTDGTKTGDAG